MLPYLDGPAVYLLCPGFDITWYCRTMETGSKGNKVDVNTFKKCGKDNIIGRKMIEEGGWKCVH